MCLGTILQKVRNVRLLEFIMEHYLIERALFVTSTSSLTIRTIQSNGSFNMKTNFHIALCIIQSFNIKLHSSIFSYVSQIGLGVALN